MIQESILKFRRQFIASSKQLKGFSDWKYTEFSDSSLHIYTHPDLDVMITDNKNNKQIALIGFVIDSTNPDKTNDQILNDLFESTTSIDDFTIKVSDLAGRYVLILNLNSKKYIMHDMCGLRTVYYSFDDNQTYLASQPGLMSKAINLVPSENYKTYTESPHYKNDIEYWLPCGLTLYENVSQLTPNHYLETEQKKQIRYWPIKKIEVQELDVGSRKASKLLQDLIIAASKRFKIALPVTAGWDSRILLAASKDLLNDFFVYTLQYRWLVNESPDIKIPKHLLGKYNITFNQLDCRIDMNPEFYSIYKSNVDLAHDDWAKITNGMFNKYPKGRVVLRGNISEIARCSFYPDGKHDEVTKPEQFIITWPEMIELPFILNYINEWINEVKELCPENNVDIFDLWYMEQFMGGWQAQGQLEWDIVHEEFTPYNCRPLIETLLSVPIKYRLHNKPILYEQIMKKMWPELLYWPFNPPSWNKRHQMKYFIADKMKKIGVYNYGLLIYKKFHPLYMKLKLQLSN